MNRDEERLLRDIERSLECEDPGFARNIRDVGDSRGLARWSNGIVAFGAVVAVLGLLAGSVYGGLGLLVVVIGVLFRLAMPVFGPSTQDEPNTGA